MVALFASLFAVASQTPLTVTATPHLARPGEVIVLTITTAQPAESLHVRAFERDLLPYALGARTWRVLVGIDLEVKPGEHVISIGSTAGSLTYRLRVAERRFPQRTLTVDEAFVNPPPEVQARIDARAHRLERCGIIRAVEMDGPCQAGPDLANSAAAHHPQRPTEEPAWRRRFERRGRRSRRQRGLVVWLRTSLTGGR